LKRTAFLAAAVALAVAAACARRPKSSFRAPPIVLISIDTLRADHLPAYGYRGVATPAIDALARDSILFENAYCPAPLTLPSHTTLLTGLLPTEHGVRDNVGFRLAPEHRTIATELKNRGYATGAAVSSFALRRDRGLAAGFDLYDDDFGPGGLDERAGPETVRRLEGFVESRADRPLFLFLHLYEPHTPYAPPEPFRGTYAAHPYDGEIAAADAAVGDFLAFLKRLGLYDHALVVLVSDHGEGLGDHGEEEHGVFLYRETIRVPLLVKLPQARRAGEHVSSPAGLVDVFPTIAETAGVPASAGRAGLALFDSGGAGSASRVRRIYSETLYPRLQLGWSDLASLTDDRWSYIEAPRPELYDIVADPEEKRDLASSLPPALRSMRAELVGLRRPAVSPERASSEELEKLGSLGYIRVDAGSGSGKNLPDPKDRIGELRRYKQLFAVFYAHRDAEAASLARALLEGNPQILSVWRILATSLARQGKAAEAARALETAFERPDLTGSAEDVEQTAAELAALLPRSGDPAAAQKALARLHERGIGGEAVRRELARALHREGRVTEALALLESDASSRDPETLDAYGALLAESGRLEESRVVLMRAREADPRNPRVLLHLGMLELREKNFGVARDWFQKSLAADPEAAGTLSALGLAQVELGDVHAALESWRRALVLDPKQYDTLFNSSVLAGRTGDSLGARRGLERFIATAPASRYAAQIAEARKILRSLPAGRS
jgi:choline-sulfatase